MQIKQTKKLESVFEAGRHEARRRRAPEVTMDHLFLAILKQDAGHADHILKKLLREWEIYQIRIRLERELGPVSQPEQDGAEDRPVRCDEALVLGRMAAAAGGAPQQNMFHTGHLLYAVVCDRSLVSARVLALYNVNRETVEPFLGDLPPDEDYYEDMRMLLGEEHDDREARPERLFPNVIRIASLSGAGEEKPRESQLDRFGVDLTRAAAEGKLDPVVGREKEIERVVQILGRRKKNNPVLIGEAGVGKSAIVEGLALRIVRKDVPHSLLHKRIFSLDVASLVAGTKYRGQFEERIHALLKELSGSDVILFIDEIHTIVGAGSTQGSLDTANILKPALARGELQCIGATTLDEYRENIETDSALERRFQKIVVEQPTPEETLDVLKRIREQYEAHHCVRYTDAALAACVDLTHRYVTDRFFPDKAIDAMDEAGSRAHVFGTRVPDSLTSLERDAEQTARERCRAIEMQNYEMAATLRNRESALRVRMDEVEAQWREQMTQSPVVIDEQAVCEVVASMTGIPVTRISDSERDRLREMEKYLSSVVIGQDEAVRKVTRAIRRSRAGLKEAGRPIGVFMFVGPTGVGKTHIAKQLAGYLFDSEDALVRIDMSEYSEKHNVSRLIGSPPGYVGYGEGGQLTEKVRRRPYCVLLFDEIEKAHSDVFNLMLQIFDEGHLTDGLGRRVDFRNTVIVMTSNVGSRESAQRPPSVGYKALREASDRPSGRDDIYRKSLEQEFAPEFINRIDDIVVFGTLGEEDVLRIVDLELARLENRVLALGYALEVGAAARKLLVEKGYDSRYGVRSLRRTILSEVEEPLAERIVAGEVRPGDRMSVGVENGKFVFTVVPSDCMPEGMAS